MIAFLTLGWLHRRWIRRYDLLTDKQCHHGENWEHLVDLVEHCCLWLDLWRKIMKSLFIPLSCNGFLWIGKSQKRVVKSPSKFPGIWNLRGADSVLIFQIPKRNYSVRGQQGKIERILICENCWINSCSGTFARYLTVCLLWWINNNLHSLFY